MSGKTLAAETWKGGVIFSFWEELISAVAAIPLFFLTGLGCPLRMLLSMNEAISFLKNLLEAVDY